MTDNIAQSKQRILALDIMRGMTIAGMILVNNPGSHHVYEPLEHAEWFGLTPTDLVFPFFMFIMGITTYLSLKKYQFKWSWSCARKIMKRALLLWFIGLFMSWLFMFVRSMINPTLDVASMGERLWVSVNTLDHIRILGVLPRLGICYGLAAVIAMSVKHRYIPWLIALVFIVYVLILELFNGYDHDATSILAIVDHAVLGPGHVYRFETPDPEGVLSTLPALAHVLIGFCVGKYVMELKSLDSKIEQMFLIGTLLTFAGFLLAYGCPISKKLWTPTFALVTCGMGLLLLAVLTWVIDKKNHQDWETRFFEVFGVNPLALFVLSGLLLIPFGMLKIGDLTIQKMVYNGLSATILSDKVASLTWAILYVLINWSIGYILYKKKIFIKL
ncbi:MAG: DUF5009 domain-containing protein [Prevotella sp.]